MIFDLASVMLGYILGSIPFGLLLSRWAGLGDVRTVGSGNIGATNVLRMGNKTVALLTLLLDGGKGAAAVLIAKLVAPDVFSLAGVAALVGHCFPIWLRFAGGKGVATLLGVVFAFSWQIGIIAMLVWVAVAILFRLSSLASIVTAFLIPPLLLFFAAPHEMIPSVFMSIVVVLRHSTNIQRLLQGTEPRIGADKKKQHIPTNTVN